ncbi:MAG: signal peptidase II [Patescibacteria group bacterium]
MFKDIKKMIAINLAIIFFIGLDRFLKVFAFSSQASEFNLLGEILKFGYKANYYIAFSLPLAGRWLNIVICFIILSLIYYLARTWQGGKRETAICLLAIIAGAASNLFDRFKYGLVIDYLDLKYFTVFNFADVMITIGVFMLLLNAYKKEAG